jgi:protein involved in polysaccharide export with SLBB domain
MKRQAHPTRVSLILVLIGTVSNPVAGTAQAVSPAQREASQRQAEGGGYFEALYTRFYESYRLGAGDDIAVRVLRQPDYTLEKVHVSPVGRIYHPLVGDVFVAGLTINEAAAKLTVALGEFLKSPTVSVALIDAASAKIAVIGEVARPGIQVLNSPMRVLDAINAAGGVTEFGRRTNITLVRQAAGGTLTTREINVKQILQGRASADQNALMNPGDTLVVHSNAKKAFQYLTSWAGFATFAAFLVQTARNSR